MGCLRMALSCPQFWFTLLLTLAVLLMPVIAIRFEECSIRPTLSDRVRLKQRLSRIRAAAKAQLPSTYPHRRKSSIRRSRRSVRSGYAFAHQEGFGTLIMSGKLAQKPSMRFGGGVSGMPSTESGANVSGAEAAAIAIGSGTGSFASTTAASLTGARPVGYTSTGRPTLGVARSYLTSGFNAEHSANEWEDNSPPPVDYQPPTSSQLAAVTNQAHSQSFSRKSPSMHVSADHGSVEHVLDGTVGTFKKSSEDNVGLRMTSSKSLTNMQHVLPQTLTKTSVEFASDVTPLDDGSQLRRRMDRQASGPENNASANGRKLQPQPSLQLNSPHESGSRVFPVNTAPSSIDI